VETDEGGSSVTEGRVVRAFGNLVHVEFDGDIRQGAVAFVELSETLRLKAEVIEIAGNIAKMQVFEETRDIAYGTRVRFEDELLEAELGPGLIGSIFDGLQNPLEKVADASGLFLSRGVYIPPLDRSHRWEYRPHAEIGARLQAGEKVGEALEGRFHHAIMVPFAAKGSYTVEWVIEPGAYTIDTVVAKLKGEKGESLDVTMVQKWPMKAPLQVGKKVKADSMLSTGLRIIDTQFPLVKGGTFCTPGPFGAGKTVIQHHFSKFSDVDIVIIAACGERAGEVVEVLKTFPFLVDPHTSESLMSRTVIICNTSSMPVAAREASVYLGATLGEYYRQMGLNVLLLADSTSRWAQAMREMSGRLEEIPGEEAFPAYLASRIAARSSATRGSVGSSNWSSFARFPLRARMR
jgi:V/A-type H+-transporting ATPase subunit A